MPDVTSSPSEADGRKPCWPESWNTVRHPRWIVMIEAVTEGCRWSGETSETEARTHSDSTGRWMRLWVPGTAEEAEGKCSPNPSSWIYSGPDSFR